MRCNYAVVSKMSSRCFYKIRDCVTGKRDTETGEKRWESVKAKATGDVMTDYYRPYEAFVPVEKHTQSKAETFTVEGYNSFFRHFLARMRRKTKCYSKCKKNAQILVQAPHDQMEWRPRYTIL